MQTPSKKRSQPKVSKHPSKVARVSSDEFINPVLRFDRVISVKELLDFQTDLVIRSACWKKNKSEDSLGNFLVRRRLGASFQSQDGSQSAFGDAYLMCSSKCTNKDCTSRLCVRGPTGDPELQVVAKVQSLNKSDLDDLEDIYNVGNGPMNSTQVETLSMMLCTELVLANICPNLPILYGTMICMTCSDMIRNMHVLSMMEDRENFEELVANQRDEWVKLYSEYAGVTPDMAMEMFPKRYTDIARILQEQDEAAIKASEYSKLAPCIVWLTEYAEGGDVYTFWRDRAFQITKVGLDGLHIQVLMALAAVHHYLDLVHYDCHLENILVHPVTQKEPLPVYKYVFSRGSIYLPVVDAVYVLSDFGQAQFSPPALKRDRFFGIQKDVAQISELISIQWGSRVPPEHLVQVRSFFPYDTMPRKELIDLIFDVYHTYTEPPSVPHVIEATFDMNKHFIPRNPNLQRFVR